MRGERTSKGYEAVFVVTKQQRDAYAEAIRAETFKNPVTGEVENVRVSTTKAQRFGDKGWRVDVQTRAEELPASRAVNKVNHDTFPVGTRVRTLVVLTGPRERPAGTLGTITATEGYGYPLVSFDGEEGGPYTVGPWWMEVVPA